MIKFDHTITGELETAAADIQKNFGAETFGECDSDKSFTSYNVENLETLAKTVEAIRK